MIVVRFKVKCQTGGVEQAMASFARLIAPSRALPGCISFDIGRDLADPDCFIATEVFEDREALDRQEALPQTQATIELLGEVLAGEPEATIYHVSSSEPWG